jgi:hypothetical protein
MIPMRAYRLRLWLGIMLLALGLSGHLLTAAAAGGGYIQYRDHIFGFVFLSAITWAIMALLGRRYWANRHDITLLILGVVQAILGLLIYSRSV